MSAAMYAYLTSQQRFPGCGARRHSLRVRGWGGVSDHRGRICVPCAASELIAALRAEQDAYETRRAAR